MLEYLRLDEGLRAGLTNSPDFFLKSGGLIWRPSSSSSSLSEGDSVMRSGMRIVVSVEDLEWEILRADALRAVGEWIVVVGSEADSC